MSDRVRTVQKPRALRTRRLSLLASVVLPAAIVASAAQAQDVVVVSADEGTVVSDGVIVLDPVIVSGEKLPRERFETYASVGVVTGEEIEDLNIEDLNDALNMLANVRALPSGTGDSNFSIRGLNGEGVTQPSARSQPIVQVSVDGALQGVEATRRGSRGIWDVDQIEVFRGPQSTLQGRNALGGAVVIETNDPIHEYEAIFSGEGGSDDRISGAFVFNAPIVQDQVAVRVAGQAYQSRNDITYTDPALKDLGKEEFEEIRGKILITPEAIPGLSALLTLSRTHDKPSWNTVTGPNFYDRVFDDPANTAAEFRDTTVDRYIAELGYDFGNGWNLESTTALADTHVDINSPPGSIFARTDTRDVTDLTQDLRVTYDNGGPLSGVFGLFAGQNTSDVKSSITTDTILGTSIPVSAIFGTPSLLIQDLDAEFQTTSIAAYTEMRYKMWDRFTVIGGGRLLRDEVSARIDGEALDFAATQAAIGQCFVLGCVPQPAFAPLVEDSSVANVVALPKIGLAFDITPDQTIAATVNRGYRPGFSEVIPGSTQINVVDPEYLWSYELAYRSRWLGDSLEFDANGFYYDYKDQQILTDNPAFPGQTIALNAGSSHAYGAEFEMRYRPIAPLQVFGSLGLVKTEFDDTVTVINGALVNLEGNAFPEAPTVTATVGALWHHHSGVFAGADVSYTDNFYSSGDLLNEREVGGYTLVNAQLGYEVGPAKIAGYVRNLFDVDYLTSIGANNTFATVGDGRQFGIRGTVRF